MLGTRSQLNFENKKQVISCLQTKSDPWARCPHLLYNLLNYFISLF